MKRRLAPGTFGDLKSRIPRVTFEGEVGFLTPVRQAMCGYHVFRCRCGAEVSKVAKQVKRLAGRGGVPRCSPKCTGVPPEQAAPEAAATEQRP